MATRPVRDVLDITGLPTGGVDLAHTSIDAGTLLAWRYRVQRLLGRGGMGAVYLADDLRLKQPVALKLLPAELARDPKRLTQFHNEVSLARQIFGERLYIDDVLVDRGRGRIRRHTARHD